MTAETNSRPQRIAINIGAGYVPGLDLVVTGAALAAHKLGWEIFGIRDGYDGLLYPGRYPDGGLLNLRNNLLVATGCGGSLLGTAARTDPFNVRQISASGEVEEVDCSGDVLNALNEARIDAVISLVGASAITGMHALSVAYKLHRKGLPTVCVPKSVENEIAEVPHPFGYNSVLSHTAGLLDGIRTGAFDSGRLAVVEVPGQHAGWLALQSGLAARADAILMPEIPYDMGKLASVVANRVRDRRAALIVVAEGARAVAATEPQAAYQDSLRASLTPNADPALGEGEHVIDRTGAAAKSVVLGLQRLTGIDLIPFSLGHLVRGGMPSTTDRELGLAYGAAAVRALQDCEHGAMLSYLPPDLKCVPIREVLSRVRTVPQTSELMKIARALGIEFGD